MASVNFKQLRGNPSLIKFFPLDNKTLDYCSFNCIYGIMRYLNEDEQLHCISFRPVFMKGIENPSVEFQIKAFGVDEDVIRYLNNPCEEIRVLKHGERTTIEANEEICSKCTPYPEYTIESDFIHCPYKFHEYMNEGYIRSKCFIRSKCLYLIEHKVLS